jgi:hypothetical protein
MVFAHMPQSWRHVTVGFSLVRFCKGELVTGDICAYSTEIGTYDFEYLTGKTSLM